MDTTQTQAQMARYPVVFENLTTPDASRLAKWRALWRALLASGETPPASAAEASAEAGTFRSQPAETSA